jgi:predicted Zn-dependent protease
MLRALLGLLAIAACGWFVLGVRQTRDTDRATALLSAGTAIKRGDAARVSSLLDGASLLNPDRQVDVLRAQLERDQGDLPRARSILERVVASEPSNLLAWATLAEFSIGEPGAFRAAALRIRQLAPPVPPPP